MKLLLSFLLSAHCLFCIAQSKLIAKIDTPATFTTADNLDNLYIITRKNELLKFNAAGKLLWRYSDKTFGKLAYADASDPMRILLFYPGLQQIVALNNNLNEIARYAFTDISKQVTLVASANTNGYWYFDQANFQLNRLANDFSEVQQSGNIYQQTGKIIQPDFIQATAQHVYLHDPKTGIMQFDRFGAYLKTILTPAVQHFQVRDEFIWYLKGNLLSRLSTRTYATDEFPIPVSAPLKQVVVGSKIIAIATEKSVLLYTFAHLNPKE